MLAMFRRWFVVPSRAWRTLDQFLVYLLVQSPRLSKLGKVVVVTEASASWLKPRGSLGKVAFGMPELRRVSVNAAYRRVWEMERRWVNMHTWIHQNITIGEVLEWFFVRRVSDTYSGFPRT